MNDERITRVLFIVGLSIVWLATHNWIAIAGAIVAAIQVPVRKK